MAKIDLLRLAADAEDHLAPIFGLRNPSTVVVLRRVSGSAYTAQFDPDRNVVFIDVHDLKRWDEVEVLHTIGEEVGHALHHILRPDIFQRAQPPKEAVIRAVEDGRFAGMIRDSLLASNLIEMVGFLAGLWFLEARAGKETVKRYREVARPDLEPWTMAEGMSLIDLFTNLHSESVSKAFEETPQKWKADAEAARPNSLPKDANRLMIQLKHRMGYRLALVVHAQPRKRQEELFRLALRSNTLLEFHEQAALVEE